MKKPAPKPKPRGLKANYGDASPEDVARALLRHRPQEQTKPKGAK